MAFLREIPKVKDPNDNKQMLNYIYALEEQLRYVYANLGAENLVDGAIGAKQLQDGCITTVKLSAAAGKDLKIMSQKAVRIIAKEIERLAEDANGNASIALQTANSFSERISDAQGNASLALQTVNGFENRVEDVEQNSAEAVLRANEAYLKVEAVEGQADYVQYATPTGDIEIGDTWTQVAAPPTTWEEARAKNWSNTKMWGELYYNNVRYFVWDGTQWVPLVDVEEQRRVLTEVQVKADGALIKVEELAGTTPTVVRSTTAAVDLDGFHLYTGGTFDVESGNFNVDKDGNVKIKGYIEAMSGNIGGWVVAENNLHSGSGTNHVRLSTENGKPAIWAGSENADTAPFRVNKDGSMKAESGNIGGWVVAENNLHSGSGTNHVRLSTENGKPAIWAGSENADTAPFRVNKDGSMKAESGNIGGWVVAENNLHSGSGTNHVRLSTENGKPAIWAGSENADTAPFRVNKDGSMKAESGSIGGWNIAPGNLSSGSGTKHVRLSTEDATYAIWAGAEAGASAPFRVTPDGKVYLTKLYVTDEDGNAQPNPVNLSGNFWKMDKAYSSNVVSAKATNNSDGTTTITFSTRGGEEFNVNFKKADYSKLELRQSDPQGRDVFVYDPSKHTYNVQKTVQAYDNNTYIGKYETINETSGTEAYDDGFSSGYGNGYNKGFDDGKDAYQPTSIVRTGYGSDGKSVITKAANSKQDVLTNQTVDATGVYNNGWNECIDNCIPQSSVYTISEYQPGSGAPLYMKVGDNYTSVGTGWVRVTRATGMHRIPSKK